MWGLQAIADGSLPDLLDRADAATGERVIGAIQRTGGNRAVQRWVPGEGPPPGAEAGPEAPKGIGPAPSAEKQASTLDKIKIIVGEKEGEGYTWVGPMDESELGGLWSSFGTGIVSVYEANPTLWQRSIERGMEMDDMPLQAIAARMLSEDVKGIAGEYVKKNLEDVKKAQADMGFDDETKTPTAEQEEKRKDVEWAAVQVQELQKAKERIEQTYVGWAKHEGPVPFNDPDGNAYPVPFVPGGPPPLTPAEMKRPLPADMPMVPYDEVMAQWKPVSGALVALADEYPAVFVGMKEGKLGQLSGEDPTDDPVAAMRTSLAAVAAAIAETQGKVGSGDLDWHKLHPIHRQLMEGERKGQLAWSHPVYKEILKEEIGDWQSVQSYQELGIGIAAAVAFIFAEIASGGLATAFLIGGLGISAGQTVGKWKDWSELKSAAGSAASSKTALVDEEQVDAALIEAILQTAFSVLDAWQGLKAGAKIYGGLKASRAGAKAASLEGLEAVVKGAAKGVTPEATQLVEKAVVEVGVEDTMARMGLKDPAALMKFVPEGSTAASRILAYSELVAKGIGKDVDLPAVLANIGKEVAERGATQVDELVQLAVERYGPLKTVQMSGGWKHLASALGTDSAAGKVILSWRDAIYRDLKAFVEGELGAAVKETGTMGSFTNDLDMSFLGKEASANRETALQFLAARSGLAPNPGMLDKMLYIGLFTDPRRMHLFDQFPELAGELAKKTASFEEQLIWNAELKRVAANTARHKRVLEAMEELGIKVIDDFKPLSDRAAGVLAAEQDRIAAEIEELAAREAPDKALLGRRLEELANTQAQINVKEGGGYFSGGGVRRFVTEDPKSPFPGYRTGEAPLKQGTEAYTAALDQVNKLRDAAEKLSEAALQGPVGNRRDRGLDQVDRQVRRPVYPGGPGARQGGPWRHDLPLDGR